MRLDPSVVIEIATRLQDAAIDPLRWSDALEALRVAFGAKYASLMTYTAHAPVSLVRETHVGRTPTLEERTLSAALRDHDPRWKWATHNFGRASASNLDIGQAVLRKSLAYEKQLAGQDIESSLMLSELVDSRMIVALTLDRGKKQDAFDAHDVGALQALRPLLVKALETQLRFSHCESVQFDLSNALGRLPVGIVLVDATKSVQFASKTAIHMLNEADGLDLSQGKLRAEQFSLDRALQDAIGQAVTPQPESASRSEETMTVKRRSGRLDYELLIAPLASGHPTHGTRAAAALVLIRDPENAEPLPWKLVQQLHSLSPAEAKLCVALAEGRALKECAQLADISIETARSQLKAAMGKTRTHRQAELIRVLLTGPTAYAMLAPPPQ